MRDYSNRRPRSDGHRSPKSVSGWGGLVAPVRYFDRLRSARSCSTPCPTGAAFEARTLPDAIAVRMYRLVHHVVVGLPSGRPFGSGRTGAETASQTLGGPPPTDW
jgi:hypothetical protein